MILFNYLINTKLILYFRKPFRCPKKSQREWKAVVCQLWWGKHHCFCGTNITAWIESGEGHASHAIAILSFVIQFVRVVDLAQGVGGHVSHSWRSHAPAALACPYCFHLSFSDTRFRFSVWIIAGCCPLCATAAATFCHYIVWNCLLGCLKFATCGDSQQRELMVSVWYIIRLEYCETNVFVGQERCLSVFLAWVLIGTLRITNC